MGVEGLTYTQYLYGITNQNALNYMLKLENMVDTGQISQAEFARQVETITGKAVTPIRAYNGDVLGYNLSENVTVSNPNPVNSNTSTVSRGITSRPVTTTVNTGGKAVMRGLRNVGGKIAFGSALVGTAALCVGTGITLGKTIDGALYNLNPDFWDSNNLSSVNPETWKSLTAGDDSLNASLMNVLFGFDNDGNAQAYINEDAFAYMAQYMYQQGTFVIPQYSADVDEETRQIIDPNGMVYPPVPFVTVSSFMFDSWNGSTLHYQRTYNFNTPVKAMFVYDNARSDGYGLVFADTAFSGSVVTVELISGNTQTSTFGSSRVELNGKVYYKLRTNPPTDYRLNIGGLPPITRNTAYNYQNGTMQNICGYYVCEGEISSTGIEGIGDQPNATLPDTSNWDNPANILPSLQNTYPNVFNNAIDYPVIQPDGTVKNYRYVPINLPETFTRTGTQPESGNASQTNPIIDPSTFPNEAVKTITDTLTNPYPKTDTELNNPNPPENPTDTGDGSSPVPVSPTGSASSMWKIYHPTQQQIDSFGGWLWSSAFIDQILKIFNNPMEAIIGLHKVYATPIDAGNTTIKVGYLDSNVPSAYIEQQYVSVDCGTVNLYEVFGNVFDYSPFTSVDLYLPFIGIVKLNVNDVMRASINVTYGVDVLTGACLAMVNVSRDGNDSILYQYVGNCAVQYPISSGSYMGIVSSIISIAGGVAATVATGGGAAPLVLGAAGAAFNAHTNVQHSGSFSGNAGAMGGKIPYLIISRPQTKMNSDYSEMEGTPTNHYVTVGECTGYVKARAVHVINVNATDSELDEIQSLLMSGIII